MPHSRPLPATPHHLYTAGLQDGAVRLRFGDPQPTGTHLPHAPDEPLRWETPIDGYVGAAYVDAHWIAFVEHLVRRFQPEHQPFGPITVLMRQVIPQPVIAVGRPRRQPGAVRFATVRRTTFPTSIGVADAWRDRGIHVEFRHD